MPNWPRSLFGRNILLLAATVVLSVFLSFISAYALILNAQINRMTAIGAEFINTISSASFELGPKAKNALFAELDDSQYLQILPLGVAPEIGDYRENAAEKMFMQRIIDQLEYQDVMDWRIGENRTLWLRLLIGDEYYWTGVKSDTTWTPLRWLFFIMIVVIVVVTTIGVIATRQISRPLAALKQETDRLALGSDWDMAPIKGPIEIVDLANSFKRMAERLQEAETIRAETLAELSHDLRTPLARLRLSVEMMKNEDDLKASAARQVEQIDRLIDQFMDYARNAQTEGKTVFSLSELADEIAEQFGVDADVRAGISLAGQKEFIRRAIINLIENSQKYGVPPVRLRLYKTPTHAVVEVTDMGAGFDPDDASEMLRPFKRGQHEAQIAGSGLGLTIAHRAAAVNRGEIAFTRLDPKGFAAKLSFALQMEH